MQGWGLVNYKFDYFAVETGMPVEDYGIFYHAEQYYEWADNTELPDENKYRNNSSSDYNSNLWVEIVCKYYNNNFFLIIDSWRNTCNKQFHTYIFKSTFLNFQHGSGLGEELDKVWNIGCLWLSIGHNGPWSMKNKHLAQKMKNAIFVLWKLFYFLVNVFKETILLAIFEKHCSRTIPSDARLEYGFRPFGKTKKPFSHFKCKT